MVTVKKDEGQDNDCISIAIKEGNDVVGKVRSVLIPYEDTTTNKYIVDFWVNSNSKQRDSDNFAMNYTPYKTSKQCRYNQLTRITDVALNRVLKTSCVTVPNKCNPSSIKPNEVMLEISHAECKRLKSRSKNIIMKYVEEKGTTLKVIVEKKLSESKYDVKFQKNIFRDIPARFLFAIDNDLDSSVSTPSTPITPQSASPTHSDLSVGPPGSSTPPESRSPKAPASDSGSEVKVADLFEPVVERARSQASRRALPDSSLPLIVVSPESRSPKVLALDLGSEVLSDPDFLDVFEVGEHGVQSGVADKVGDHASEPAQDVNRPTPLGACVIVRHEQSAVALIQSRKKASSRTRSK